MSDVEYHMFTIGDLEFMDKWANPLVPQKGEDVAKRIFNTSRATRNLTHYATKYVIWCNLEEKQKTVIRENVSIHGCIVVVTINTLSNEISLIYPVKLYTAGGSNILQRTEIPGQSWCLKLCTDGQHYWGLK